MNNSFSLNDFVELTVETIPPPIFAISKYVLPCCFHLTSRERSPPQTMCVCESISPGIIALPPTSTTVTSFES